MPRNDRMAARDGRIVRLRVCIDCGVEGECGGKAETDFFVSGRTPDGIPSRWRARCKPCHRLWRTNYRTTHRKEIRAYEATWRRRQRQRRARGRLMPRVAIGPFHAWLKAYMRARHYFDAAPVAEDLGLVARRVQEYLDLRQPNVSVDVVDLALTNAGTFVDVNGRTIFTITDLYGEQLREAA